MKRNIFSWIVALGCVLFGVMLSYELHIDKFRADYQSLPVRIIFYVGPVGWLLFSLLTAFLLIRFPGSGIGAISAICFLSAVIAAGCVLMFAPFHY